LIWYSDSIGGLYWIDTDDPTEAVSMKIMETFIVRNLLEDYEGNIWVGTEEAGLFRLRPHVFQTLSQKGRPSDISV
jgi:ligand-binding sensor domain-containing protein